MRSSVRLALLTVAFGLLLTEPLPAYAVVSPQPGDTCTGGQTGYFTTNAGSLQQPGLFLVCDGSHWNLFQSFATAGNVGIGTATPNAGSILDLSGSTTSMLLPSGTSAQRPTAANGMIRYNSTVPQVESYYSGAWQALGGAGLTLSLGTSASATNPQRSGDATTGLFSPAINTVAIAEGGTQLLTVNATGVGIGTASPTQTLDVNGIIAAGGAGGLYIWNQGGNPSVGFNAYANGVVGATDYSGILQFGDTTGTLFYYTAASATGGTTPLYSARLTILNGGNVGIGTAAPDKALTVAGVASFMNSGNEFSIGGTTSGANSDNIEVKDLTTADTYTQFGVWGAGTSTNTYYVVRQGTSGLRFFYGLDNGGLGRVENEAGDIAFFTGGGYPGTERVRITSGGLVGIGSTSPADSLDISQKTDAVSLPSGTSAQRPTGANGMLRYNSTVPQVEAYYSGAWQAMGGATAPGTPCTSSTFYNASTNGSTQLVALSSGKIIYICGYTIIAAGTVNVQFIGGTGGTCGSGTANLTPAYELTAGTVIVDSSTITRGLQTASSAALCISTNAGVAVQAMIYYVQQ